MGPSTGASKHRSYALAGMDELQRLLGYFRHQEVNELILQADKVAALRVSGQMRALTQIPATSGAWVVSVGDKGGDGSTAEFSRAEERYYPRST